MDLSFTPDERAIIDERLGRIAGNLSESVTTARDRATQNGVRI